MTLNLNVHKLAGPGRRPAALDYSVVRQMTEADLELLTINAGIEPPPLKRITDRHHALARLLASGVGEGEASLILGYDKSRVSILKGSPAFQELLALYREEHNREFSSLSEHMAGLSRDALLALRERVEDNPEKFTVPELLRIVTDMVDRTVQDPLDSDRLPTKIELVAPMALPPPKEE